VQQGVNLVGETNRTQVNNLIVAGRTVTADLMEMVANGLDKSAYLAIEMSVIGAEPVDVVAKRHVHRQLVLGSRQSNVEEAEFFSQSVLVPNGHVRGDIAI
jgi:hypothetical protein